MARFYSPEDQTYQIKPGDFEFVQSLTAIRDESLQGMPVGFFKDSLLRFWRNKVGVISLACVLIIATFSILAPVLSQYGYNDQNLDKINLPCKVPVLENFGILNGTTWLTNRRVDALGDTNRYPEGCILQVINHRTVQGVEMCDVQVDAYRYAGVEDGVYHWLGTDYLGRDLWVRLWRGVRVSLFIAFVSVICNVFIGVVYGSVSGYYGGKADMVMMRITEIVGSMPQIVIVTLFVLFFGTGIWSIIFCLLVQNWIPTARVVRSQFYRYKGHEYVLAARTIGVGDRSLIFRHILPNSLGPVITQAMISIPGAIFMESFLAYIGLGIQAPEASIGVLLQTGRQVLLQYPNQTFAPAVVISLLMIAFNMLSNALRDAFDPSQRGA